MQYAADRLRQRRTFEEDEEVIVYDARSKLSSKGKICEVLGNNTYLVDCGTGSRHVSGDCISKVATVAGQGIGGASIDRDNVEVVNITDEEDSASIVSDNSDSSVESANFDDVILQPDDDVILQPDDNVILQPNDNNVGVRRNRHRRRQVELIDTPVANLPQLRPRAR